MNDQKWCLMEKNKNYHDEQNNMNTLKMREVLTNLPSFCKQFFRGIQDYTSSRTRLAYAYDIPVDDIDDIIQDLDEAFKAVAE